MYYYFFRVFEMVLLIEFIDLFLGTMKNNVNIITIIYYLLLLLLNNYYYYHYD